MRAPSFAAVQGALCGIIAGLLLASMALAADPPQRVVSIGGAVTEIVYALGAEDRLVARDSTSTYPAAAQALPDIGYARALSPEGVLSVGPDLVIAAGDAGPPNTIDVLKSSGVSFVQVTDAHDRQSVLDRIAQVGALLGREAEAAKLVARVGADLDAASAAAQNAAKGHPARVLFVLSAANGRLMVAGKGTSAEGIVTLAGAVNALDGFSGYKPVSDEAVIQAAPDVVLMMDRGGDHALSDDALFAIPAIAATPAGRDRRALRMDGLYLLGFGPRTAEAVADLARGIYGQPE